MQLRAVILTTTITGLLSVALLHYADPPMPTSWLRRPTPNLKGVNHAAKFPYDLTPRNLQSAIEYLYDLLNRLNRSLVPRIDMRLEELMRPNSFPDLLSEILARGIAEHSRKLVRNRKHDGFPDLIPRGTYPDDRVHHGKGIEVKASKQRGGWQGHNPEEGWLVVARYAIDKTTEPNERRMPTEIVEVFAAKLDLDDWTFSGRGATSRRTITASVNGSGVKKMRSNVLYRKP